MSGSTNQSRPKFSGPSTFPKKCFLARPYKRPPVQFLPWWIRPNFPNYDRIFENFFAEIKILPKNPGLIHCNIIPPNFCNYFWQKLRKFLASGNIYLFFGKKFDLRSKFRFVTKNLWTKFRRRFLGRPFCQVFRFHYSALIFFFAIFDFSLFIFNFFVKLPF